eukprot:3227881-Pyramimonas_sp.AAC.1
MASLMMGFCAKHYMHPNLTEASGQAFALQLFQLLANLSEAGHSRKRVFRVSVLGFTLKP